MDEKQLKNILTTHSWIKVRKYGGIEYPSPLNDLEDVDWEREYQNLMSHHTQETNFLIDTCRRLASELLAEKKK
jgi:hypothetical protein